MKNLKIKSVNKGMGRMRHEQSSPHWKMHDHFQLEATEEYSLMRPIISSLAQVACSSILGLTVLLTSSCRDMAPSAVPEATVVVPLNYLPALDGEYFEFQSKAIGRPFHIYVRLPEGYEGDESARYPVVFVLDGDSLFPILAANHLFLTYDEGLPEAIVVGISYGSFDPSINKRGVDFSASTQDSEQGGALAFQQFLKSELIPEIEERYRANPSRRILFGQSRGGYMVLYSAFTDPDLFWGRIASNPTFEPGRERFFSSAAPASQSDLGLVVTSGSRDRPHLRQAALEWFATWENADNKPWSLNTITIQGGTHSADSANSYRAGMIWLFNRTEIAASDNVTGAGRKQTFVMEARCKKSN
jgi:predicted alpha/beta superfamily hydrolase